VSGKSRRTYSLAASTSAEYEINRVPRPSGYAKVSVTLEPCLESLASQVLVEVTMDKAWHLLTFHGYTTGEALNVSPAVEEASQKRAVEGIRKGAEEALQYYLDAPVDYVRIVVNEITFHPSVTT
jgi:hypothetical protein